MLDTILSYVYKLLNCFRSPLRQIPTETTASPQMQPERRGEQQPGGNQGDGASIDDAPHLRSVPGDLLLDGGDHRSSGDTRLDDDAPPAGTTQLAAVRPDAATALKVTPPSDGAALAAHPQQRQLDANHEAGTAHSHGLEAPPPSAAVELPHDDPFAVAVEPEALAVRIKTKAAGAEANAAGVGAVSSKTD
ncbi:hypothetical protein BDZ90DRAFT_260935 [Jaminaea rosea]|uniref:Uncharacterized protein n=1 Tax=Jaminaea rosea TaxID=1569628 RepID=A0A316UQT2_9BASI|nr:hypothetical protein BDZ90DRAFT_260935 [Jaminaea rosea]PWN26671.1 hypothetical protein BDZ90DRAFT_260935 [Jaminaea rosea]